MEVNASSNNGAVPLGPESQQASSKAAPATGGSKTGGTNDINEVSSVDRAGQTSGFKHSNGETYHSSGEPFTDPSEDEAVGSHDSLDVTG